jgi:hypothetical protein
MHRSGHHRRAAVAGACLSICALGGVAYSATAVAAGPPGTNPAGRVYERVTPLDKNGGSLSSTTGGVLNTPDNAAVAANGERVLFQLQPAALADNPSNLAFANFFIAARDEKRGWETTTRTPPLPPGTIPPSTGQTGAPVRNVVSANLDDYTFVTNWQIDGDHDQDGAFAFRDIYRWRESGGSELLSCKPGSVCTAAANPVAVTWGATPDLRHILIGTTESLVPEAPSTAQVYDRTNPAVDPPKPGLRWVSQGTPLFNGTPLAATSSLPITGHANAAAYDAEPPKRGSRAFFASGGRVYVRMETESLPDSTFDTVEITRTDTGIPSSGTFLAASQDGNTAFFSSTAALTLDDHNTVSDLYVWHYDEVAGTDSLHRVAAFPNAGSGSDPSANNDGSSTAGPQFVDVVGITSDLSAPMRVYFLTRSGTANPFTWDLFVSEIATWKPNGGVDASVRHIATVVQGPASNPAVGCIAFATPGPKAWPNTCVRTSPNGRFVAFDSRLPLADADGDTNYDSFAYDARTATLRRASIGSDGPAGLRGNGPFDAHAVDTDHGGNTDAQSVANDGTVFFSSSEALVPEDQNALQDVYAFNGGQASLVSGGRSDADENSFFLGYAFDGRDAFFATTSALDPADTDLALDIYDARVGGGGFDEAPPGCFGDSCQGPLGGGGGAGKSPIPPQTSSVEGSGNATPSTSGTTGSPAPDPEPRAELARVSTRELRQLAQGRAARIAVRVNRPGRVSLRARSRLGRHVQTVARASRRAGRAGRLNLTVRLSREARRQLRRDGRLALTVFVQFGAERHADSARFTLRTTQAARPRKASAARRWARLGAVPVIADGR